MQNNIFPKKSKNPCLVYFDHAAATPTDPQVVKAMTPFWTTNFANPAAVYSLGKKNNEVVEKARQKIAEILFTQTDCITFTSGGTESNNLAILGLFKKIKSQNSDLEIDTKNQKNFTPHIITTAVEHHSVLGPIRELEKSGVAITYLPVNKQGEISVKEIIKAIRPNTKLISIMYANNEIGTINPIAEIGRELLKYRQKNSLRLGSGQATQFPYFHVDACQAAGTLDLHTERLHVDLMTLNSSKIYGPKGMGLLFVRRGVPLSPIMFGGGQESGWRSGTANVPGIVGLTKALELVRSDFEKEAEQKKKMCAYFWHKIKAKIPDTFLNGPELSNNRLSNNLNICFKNVEAETLVLYLDAYGIMAATGSACASDSNEASHVLTACGLSMGEAKSSVRFTLGKYTTKQDIDYVLKFLPGVVQGVRQMIKIK